MLYAERPSEVMGGAEGRTEGREEKREGRQSAAKGGKQEGLVLWYLIKYRQTSPSHYSKFKIAPSFIARLCTFLSRFNSDLYLTFLLTGNPPVAF